VDIFWSVTVGLLFAWVGIRLARVGVRINSEKITIRGYFVTRKVNASTISAITLQPLDNGEGQFRWIPRVELASGKSFWINSFDCGPARNPPKPELASTIDEIRMLLGVRTPDPGAQQGSTTSRVWSPSLPADPINGGAETESGPTEARSALPGSEQPAQDAASRARWATIWLVLILVVTAGGTAAFVAGYNPNGDHPSTDWTVIFTILGPFAAWVAWRDRKGYRRIDKLRKLEDELADARDAAIPTDSRAGDPATG
jgi:hypothetical protein